MDFVRRKSRLFSHHKEADRSPKASSASVLTAPPPMSSENGSPKAAPTASWANGSPPAAPAAPSTNGLPHPPEPKPASSLEKIKEQAARSLGALETLLKAMNAPLPTQTADGTDLPKAVKASMLKDVEDLIRDMRLENVNDLEKFVETVKDGLLHQPMDDRKYLMEATIAVAARLPTDGTSTFITNQLVTTLWNDLDHPPSTILGDEYRFRQPDGSKNSFLYPDVGKAGMPYARTVPPKTAQGAVLPDAGVLFDAVMARKSASGTKHPNYISSMLFYLASIIIHDIFRTDHKDFNLSNTSSYLDLAPLYGSNWTEQKKMRTMRDGKIHPDCFSETRLLTFPPGVGALLIMFNRYHNYVVEQLASINEDGRFTENPRSPTVERYGETLNKRDDDLFQTARLITCGLYINIILIDYVRTILNLNRTDDNWQLNPRVEIPGGVKQGTTGNQCSAEFNLVYRWHSAVSERDDRWTQQLFRELPLPPDMQTPEAVAEPQNIRRFLGVLAELEEHTTQLSPPDRPWPALKEEVLKRKIDGTFEDDALAALLTSSIEDCANAMGPQQVPAVMKAIEVLGIQQARTWKLATLNEFRKHFSLTPHETWEDITVNKEVQAALKHLYNTPDQVELYPGLVVEDAKEPMLPGSGLCPSYAVSRGVLSDAVALVRGDRFYTTAYTPASLTNWGFAEASSDITIDNGCVFYKLFLRTLPNNYDPASVYVHYPLTVPEEMERVLKDLGKDKLYNMQKPQPIPQPKVIFGYDAALQIINDPDTFHVTYGPTMEFLMGPAAKNFMLAGDAPPNARSRELMEKPLYQGCSSRAIPTGNEKWLEAVRAFYEDITTKLLREKSFALGSSRHVDMIRDVGNLAHVHFCAELFNIPLKTEANPHGIFTEHQLYLIMAGVFICIFFDLDPPKTFGLKMQAHAATQALGTLMDGMVKLVRAGGSLSDWLHDVLTPTSNPLKDYGVHMIAALCRADANVDDLVWGNIMGTAGGMVANQGQLFGQILDFYFTDAGNAHWPAIRALALENTPEADDKLMHYLMEAARLHGETGVFRYATKAATIVDTTAHTGSKTLHFLPGDKVMINLKAASRDPAHYHNPDDLDLTRPLDSYLTLGHGRHQCLGLPMTRVALTTMLKVIARECPNLGPAPVAIGGRSQPSAVKKVLKEFVPGDLATIPASWHYHLFLTENWDMYFPFPTSLKLRYDTHPAPSAA